MQYSHARYIAEGICTKLGQYCERIKIAGSVRRIKPECRDIELVCWPKLEEEQGLFGGTGRMVACKGFVDAVNYWEKVKGEPTGKYTQRIGPEGIKLDIFMANKDNWGLILAIRTGSAEYSKRLANQWVKLGYHSVDGILTLDGTPVSVHEEVDLFRLLKLQYVEPKDRNV
jgi:DNA polymerase/3'-5' exonuclease PolX